MKRFIYIHIILIFTSLFFVASHVLADRIELKYPNAKNKLFIDIDKKLEYSKLANKVGLRFDHQYSYTQFSDMMRANKIGADGQFEWILLSTGGSENDWEASNRFNKVKKGWKMEYYSSHNLTMVYEVAHDDSRTFTYVRILKLCKGRNTSLNLE